MAVDGHDAGVVDEQAVAPIVRSRRVRRNQRPRASALYDEPGPRGRRVIWISSVVAGVALVAVLWLLVYRPLDAKGQFAYKLWGPFLDPSNDVFGLLWSRLGDGILATLKAAGLAIVASATCGVVLGVLRFQLKKLIQRRYASLPAPVSWTARALTWILNALARVGVDLLRGMPVVVTIFFVARLLPEYGVDLGDAIWYLGIGLTLYNMVVIGEVLRSGMEGLPKGQGEAASSLGFSTLQTSVLILLPQAIRMMLPALISELVVVLKDTSLGFIISYEELLNVGKTVTLVLSNPIQTYVVIGLIYLSFNYALSQLADWTQRRLARARA